jgi:hypothetical protein
MANGRRFIQHQKTARGTLPAIEIGEDGGRWNRCAKRAITVLDLVLGPTIVLRSLKLKSQSEYRC